MLSNNLLCLLNHFQKFAGTGMDINPETVVAMCAIFESCRSEAQQLEARKIPVIDQAQIFPVNVIRLPRPFQLTASQDNKGGAA